LRTTTFHQHSIEADHFVAKLISKEYVQVERFKLHFVSEAAKKFRACITYYLSIGYCNNAVSIHILEHSISGLRIYIQLFIHPKGIQWIPLFVPYQISRTIHQRSWQFFNLIPVTGNVKLSLPC